MTKYKNPKKTFALIEENGEVYAKLDASEDYGVEMTISDVPNVRVRAPRPKKEHLREMAELWGKNDPMFSSSDEWLKHYAEGMNREIIDHLQEIRKSMKRIQTLSCCIKTAQQIAKENAEKT